MTPTNTVSRTAIAVACIVGGAVGRVALNIFQIPLPLFAGDLPRILLIALSHGAAVVVTGVVGWHAHARITAWAAWLEREWAEDRKRRQDGQAEQ